MLFRTILLAIATSMPATVGIAQTLPPAPVLKESPWNGDWVLSRTRNTKEIKAAAADGYRFQLESDGRIRWEIPSLQEVVEGRTDGRPMPIRRSHSTTLTLAVSVEGPRVLIYHVARNGQPEGEGRMTLVDQGRAWVDISQPAGRPDLAGPLSTFDRMPRRSRQTTLRLGATTPHAAVVLCEIAAALVTLERQQSRPASRLSFSGRASNAEQT